MKKHLSAAAVLLVLCTLLSGTVHAEAASGSLSNFQQTRAYTGQFSDVSRSDWYYDNVAALYALGLTEGSGSGDTFSPNDPVTVAEVLAFSARIYSLYTTGSAESGPNQFAKSTDTLWYTRYVRYLSDAGIIQSEFAQQYTANASRAQTAYVLARLFPEGTLSEINADAVSMAESSRRLISDVTDETTYADEILQLYRWGIVSGSDEYGTFHPKSSITRGELAAMLTRLVGASDRLTLAWTYADAVSAQGLTYGDLVTGDYTFYSAPTTEEEVVSTTMYLLANEMTSVTLEYGAGGLTKEGSSQIAGLFLSTLTAHPEFMYNQVSSTFAVSRGTLTITFESTCIENTTILEARRDYSLQAAIEVHDTLWENGTLTANMSQVEKAKVYFDWICENCEYGQPSAKLQHTSYSVFAGKVAVCDGYTGAYNLLLRLEGIDCTTATYGSGSSKHMWTVAELDGVTYHIDTTWGDSSGATNYQFFAMTPEQSWALHTGKSAA